MDRLTIDRTNNRYAKQQILQTIYRTINRQDKQMTEQNKTNNRQDNQYTLHWITNSQDRLKMYKQQTRQTKDRPNNRKGMQAKNRTIDMTNNRHGK